ncbi:MAG TPA: acyl-CoA dehydrogenase [Actinomycetota bacterium]
MNFAFSDEQEELRRTIRRFCEQRSPSTEVRRLMETTEGHDEAVWKQMAQELGLQGLATSEQHGGQGFGFIELGIVMEEFGRALLCAPFFSTVCLAASALANAGGADEILQAIAAGERIVALAHAEANGRWDAAGITATATPDGDGFRLDGEKTYVIDGLVADTLIVAARAPGSAADQGVGLFLVAADADGVSREPLNTMDLTRKQARVTLAGARARALGDPGAGWAVLEKTLQQGAVMLAAECVGGAQRCLDMAVEYAKTREQFGRPIGQFQAIKHKCADMLLQVESARTAAYYAMWAAATGDEELPIVASLAKAYATEAYFSVASENIQVHGGIGFTWEHDAHLYYKRAKSSELLFGDPTYHRGLIADRLGI